MTRRCARCGSRWETHGTEVPDWAIHAFETDSEPRAVPRQPMLKPPTREPAAVTVDWLL